MVLPKTEKQAGSCYNFLISPANSFHLEIIIVLFMAFVGLCSSIFIRAVKKTEYITLAYAEAIFFIYA